MNGDKLAAAGRKAYEELEKMRDYEVQRAWSHETENVGAIFPVKRRTEALEKLERYYKAIRDETVSKSRMKSRMKAWILDDQITTLGYRIRIAKATTKTPGW